MKKKIIYSSALTALLCASSVALAGGPEIIVEPDYFSGFYIGGTGALQHATFDSNSALTLDEPISILGGLGIIPPINIIAPGTIANNDTDGESLDGFGGIQGGFGKVFNHQWYLGIQGFGQWGSQSDTSVNSTQVPFTLLGVLNNVATATSTTKVKIENNYGVAAKLGYVVAPRTMVYGKVGASWTDLEVTNTASVANNFDVSLIVNLLNVNTFASTSNSESDTKVGLLLGIGFEQFVYQDLVSVNVEYDYVNYGSVDTGPTQLSGQTTITTPFIAAPLFTIPFTPVISSSASGDATVSSILAGINFYFGRNWF